MSLRTTPRTIVEQVNYIEEQLRRLLADLAATPSDVRFVVDARGDLLVGRENNVLSRLPRGSDGEVLTVDETSALGLAWEAINAVRSSLFTMKGAVAVGAAAGTPAALEPGADGDVLTVNASSPLGLSWQPSVEGDATLLAWLAMGMAS